MFELDKKNIFILSVIFFLIGVFFRIYHLNFESYWWDEILAFWINNPDISDKETYLRRDLTDQTSLLYHFIVKYFYSIFGYDSEIGRYVPFLFGVIAIPLLGILSYQIKSDYSYSLTILLISLNVYLIYYSQENRHYSFVFLLSIVNLIYYYKILSNDLTNNQKAYVFILYTFFTVISLSEHPFILIILFSQFIYALYLLVFFKKRNFLFFSAALLSSIIYLYFNYDFLINNLISKENHFVTQVTWKFIYNLFFPRFFGSLIMGLLYLIILFYLIIYFRRKIFLKPNNYFPLILIFSFSYLIPLFYGLLFTPILFDRYIIFILIPILILISTLILEIKNYNLKRFLLILLVFFTLANQSIESYQKSKHKPDFQNLFNYLNASDTKNISIIITENIDTVSLQIVENYIFSLQSYKQNNLKLLQINKLPKGITHIWAICYEPFTGFICDVANTNGHKWEIKDEVNFHHVSAKLFKISD